MTPLEAMNEMYKLQKIKIERGDGLGKSHPAVR